MSDFGGTFRGTGIALFADTSFAMAQLRALQDYARLVRGELGTMPAAPGPVTRSPLIAPSPSGTIPGGRIDNLTMPIAKPKGITIDTGTPVTMKRNFNAIPVDIPDEPAAAAPARNRTGAGRGSRGNAASPGDAASGDAMDRHFARMGKQVGAGPVLTNTSLQLGPLSLNGNGANLRGAFMKTLGPAAIFMTAVYAEMRAFAALGESVESALAEAQSSGKDLGDVLVEKAAHIPGRIAAGIVGGGVGLFLDAAEGAGKFGVGVLALLGAQSNGQADGNIQAYKKVFSDAKTDLSDALTGISGGKKSWEIKAELQQAKEGQLKRIRAEAMEAATQQAQEDARKAAEQLLGMGFPGTLDDLNEIAKRAYMAKYERDIDEKLNDLENTEGVRR